MSTITLPRARLHSPLLSVRVWLTRQTIDNRIARGESLAGPELSHRAEQLASTRTRRSLAAGLERVLHDAERPSRTLSAAVPLQRRAIRHARPALERLVADLEADDSVNVQGIARVQLLLTDGASPLYSTVPEGTLDEALGQAHAALLLA